MDGKRRILLGMFLCLIIGIFVFLVVEHSRVLKTFDLAIMDWSFRLNGPLQSNKKIVLIKIDDKTISALGYPINRGFYAMLLDGLSEFEASMVGIDVIFSSKDISHPHRLSDTDAFLVESCKKVAVYHPIGFHLQQTGQTLCLRRTENMLKKHSCSLKGYEYLIDGKSMALCPFPQLLEVSRGVGHINLIPDIDGKVRRVPLLIRYNNRCYPCMGLALAGAYLGIQPKCFNRNTKKLLFGNISIPVNNRCEMLIQNANHKIINYSMLDVVQSIKAIKKGKKPLIPASCFKDKIILIGITASGSTEFCPTSFSNIELMLHVHSNIINTILNKRFIKELPLWIYGLIAICCGLIAGLCCFLFASPVSRILLTAGLIIAYGLSVFLSLRYMNLQINMVAPVLTIFLSSVTVIIYQYLLEKKDMVQSLTEMTNFNENILTSMSSGLIVVDSLQRVKKINHVAMNILGFEKEADVLGKTILPARLSQILSNALETKEVIKKRTILLGNKNLEINVSYLKNNSIEAQGAVILIDDITKIVELEEQARLNERLADIGILASRIGHEIGNSLTVIILFADNLKEILAGQGQQVEIVEEIIKEANMLAKKTSALKNYARPVTLELQKTDVNQMLETVLRKISREVKSNNIEVTKNLKVDLPLIMLDIDHMEGAVLNLVINAIHAMPAGGILTVGTDIVVLDGYKKVEITIRDTGSGISPDIQGKIFNPFFTTKKQEGTGLGLSIVHKIISSHKGTVSFESEEGKGTTFIVRLPVDED